MRENIAEILELAHYKVITAINGKEGVRLVNEHIPDLIICDIMMPELDGYGVLHLLSKEKSTAHIPFIFLTARSERSDLRKGMNMGADDFLTKPFDDTELLATVEMRLKKNHDMKEEFSRTDDGLTKFMDAARGLVELEKLSHDRRVKIYNRREIIYLEGNLPNGIYFIVKGKVKTNRTSNEGKELVTGLYNEGDFFGYHALLENTMYNDSATTLDDAELIMIPKEDFFKLLFTNSDVAARFIKMLSNNVQEMEERLVRLAYHSVRKRVAEALIDLKNRYATNDSEVFSMPVPREDLAAMVGTATESVIRTLSDLKDEKLIEIKGRTITILDAEKLKRLRN
jgi:CRP-like cAMP-binding protein/CheY-like chemotaxis protein